MKTKGLSAILVVCAVCLLTPAPSPAAVNVTAKIKVPLKSSVFEKTSATTTNTYFLKNSSTATFTGPFRVVVESLNNRDVALVNPDGYTREGKPYFEYSESILGPNGKSAGKPWFFQHRCGRKVSATVKPFNTGWQIAFQGACSPLVTVYVSVFSSEGGANHTPVANAGPDQTVKARKVIALDGSLSTDEDGDPLTYLWSVVSKPAGSRVTLTNKTSVKPTVRLSMAGTYVLGLTVNDGVLTSSRDTCTLSTSNSRPVAEAGPDQTVELGTVKLDGSRSTDADGNRLTYAWAIVSMPPGAEPNLDNPSAVRPSFMADTPGEYVLQLVVSHGTRKSFPDFSRISAGDISTASSQPRASAGADQKVTVGATVHLDGVGSTDVDGDPLTYRWALLAKPAGSAAAIAESTSVRPTFVADAPGTYVAQLIVNDGRRDSAPDTVIVTTESVRPVANAGRDQTVAVSGSVTLDGSGSRGAVIWKWAFLSVPKGSLAKLSSATSVGPSFVPDKPGTYVVQLSVSDGTLTGDPDTVVIDTDNSRPAAVAGPDQDVYANRTILLDGSGSADSDSDFLTPFWAMLFKPAGSAAVLSDPSVTAPSFVADVPGTYVLQLVVRDSALSSDPDTMAVTATVQMVSVPDVVGMEQAGAASAITEAGLVVDDVTTEYDDTIDAGDVIHQDPSGGETAPEGSTVDLVVSRGPEPIPPDPGAVAPPLDQTVATTLAAATEFLYTGPDPIQRGVAPGTIEPQRAAVIRGKVSTRDGLPLSGVKITILDHPEFGRTLSRLDGMFDLAVNGGGYLTVNYAKKGYLTVQRQVNAPWQDYVPSPDVVMIGLDGAVTTVDLIASAMQVVRGSQVSDADGTRTATLLVPPGTTAQLVLPDGSTQPITTLNVRATEYTVGENGPKAMPAELPPTSGYTYAVELSADEALSAGATRLSFSQPLYFYVEDFIGFPAGSAVPTGYYDRQKGQWIASENGRVIAVLGITGGLADVDSDGDGSADSGLGITDAERQRLASIYTQTPVQLWRVPMTHFTPWDCNWPYGPPEDAVPPSQTPSVAEGEDDSCKSRGSIIDCQNQALGERLPVVGTPYVLNYRSDRMPGFSAGRTVNIPVIGDTVPASMERIDLEITVAGRSFTQSFAPGPNQTVTFTWDGLDVYRRPVQGSQTINVGIGYAYRPQYYPVLADFERSFARTFPGSQWVTARASSDVVLQQDTKLAISRWDARGAGLGGWSLDVHHAYDPVGETLYLGSGERRSAVNQTRVVDTVVGNGYGCRDYSQPCGDGGRATDAQVYVSGVDVGPDGNLYITDQDARRIYRARPDGNIELVAGLKSQHYWCETATDPCGDGGPATQARFGRIYASSVGPDGSIYAGDAEINRIRRIGPDGIMTTVAGTGEQGFAGDGGPATQAKLNVPYSARMAPDGSLYIADTGNLRIRRVGPDGIITTIAGNGGNCTPSSAPCGDGGPATAAPIGGPLDLAIGPDGSIYFGFGYRSRIRKVSPDGIITTFAGTGRGGIYSGDGGLARDAEIKVLGLEFGPDGSLFLSNGENAIRRIDTAGIITTVAGNAGPNGFGGDGGPAVRAQFGRPWYVAVGPNGHIYVADWNNRRVRRVRPFLPGYADAEIVIASGSGDEIYTFDARGRHLRTVNKITGAVTYEFGYDARGALLRVTDGDGNVTTVERDVSGNPTAIVGPFGQRTALSLEAGGYLSGVGNPAGETTAFAYTSEGLLTTEVSSRVFPSTFTYDAAGRLVKDEDAAGGFQTLARTEISGGYEVTRTTAMGELSVYRVENLPIGEKKSTYVSSCCGTSEVLVKTDGSLASTLADGMTSTMVFGPDPRFGMESSIIASSSIRTPGGRERNMSMTRAVTLSDPLDPMSLVSMTDTATVNGRAHTSLYDAAMRTRTSTSPAGRQTVAVTDAQGRPTSVGVAGLDPAGFAYDSHGRLASITTGSAGAARTFTLGYDWEGNLASITDPLARVTGFEHDAVGRVLRKNFPDGRTVHFTYDAAGNLTSITPPERAAHGFEFNAVDMLIQYAPPPLDAGGWSTTYAYDLDRRLTAITRPDGKVVSLAYSPGGNLQTIATPGGNYSFTYAPTSKHLEGISAPGGEALAFTYDGNLLLSQAWTGEVTGRIDRTFDNDFRIISRSVNGADPVAFGYDGDGLLIQSGGLSIARSAQNQLITGTTLGSVGDTRGYNSFGESTSYAAAHDATTLLSFSYVRDKLGRIVEKTETVGGATSIYSYTYDPAGRLTAVEKDGSSYESYAYDSNSNRLNGTTSAGTKSGTYDDQDRVLGYASAAYTYSANGDLETKSVGGQTTTYGYDALGNLRGVILPGGAQISYVIDGLNRRIGKKVNGTLVQGFLYDNLLHPEAELDGSGAVVSRFVYGTRSSVPDYMIKGGNTYRIISDHLASPRLVVDVSTGTVVQEMTYDSFGNVLFDSNPGFQPFGFAGGLYDRDTKLTRFGARDYDAETGRWTAKDPIRFSGGDSNIYGYVLNDPVNVTDANGKIAPVIVAVAVAVATHPEVVVGVVTAVVNEVTGTSQPYDPETAVYEAATTALINLIEEANETRNEYYQLGEELDRLLEQVRKTKEGAEMTRAELERLLEELRRMFPCHKRGGK